ncbi:hypothetical protein TNCV_4516721 [Trichonephila clavipes]|nr:hypothetical protein TNCV_4516701 [Trichonephila clavipes]GFS53117.1 hypothetical protein TNCV_4516721 [Trichonephila clavipes]
MVVKHGRNLLDDGNRPIISKLNSVIRCLVTLDIRHIRQLLAQDLASLFIDGQTNFDDNNLVVEIIARCARLWILLNQFSGMFLELKVSSLGRGILEYIEFAAKC